MASHIGQVPGFVVAGMTNPETAFDSNECSYLMFDCFGTYWVGGFLDSYYMGMLVVGVWKQIEKEGTDCDM